LQHQGDKKADLQREEKAGFLLYEKVEHLALAHFGKMV